MKIRQATFDDARLLAELNGHVQQIHVDKLPVIFKPAIVNEELIAQYAELLGDENAVFFIAEDEGLPVGYVYAIVKEAEDNPFVYAYKFLLVDQISVNPTHYGSGAADLLMDAVVTLAHQYKVKCIKLGVYQWNERAIKFYEKRGFQTSTYRMEMVLE